MNTLKGVIAASTGKGVVAPDESDLHMVPWYFILSSRLYMLETEDSMTVSGSFVEMYLSGKSAETDDTTVVMPSYLGYMITGVTAGVTAEIIEDTASVVLSYVGHLLAGKLYDTGDDTSTVTPGYVGHLLAGAGTEQSDTATVTPGYVGATIE